MYKNTYKIEDNMLGIMYIQYNRHSLKSVHYTC
jgi:hypothetical protein